MTSPYTGDWKARSVKPSYQKATPAKRVHIAGLMFLTLDYPNNLPSNTKSIPNLII